MKLSHNFVYLRYTSTAIHQISLFYYYLLNSKQSAIFTLVACCHLSLRSLQNSQLEMFDIKESSNRNQIFYNLCFNKSRHLFNCQFTVSHFNKAAISNSTYIFSLLLYKYLISVYFSNNSKYIFYYTFFFYSVNVNWEI